MQDREKDRRTATIFAKLHERGAAIRSRVPRGTAALAEAIAQYHEWTEEAEDLVRENLSAADLRMFKSLPEPQMGEDPSAGGASLSNVLDARLSYIRSVVDRLQRPS